MKFWFSGEIEGDIDPPFGGLSNRLERVLNKHLGAIDYGAAVRSWNLIFMILGPNDPGYDEVVRYWKRDRSTEFRLRVSHRAFKRVDRRRCWELLARTLLRSVEEGRALPLGRFDYDRLAKEIRRVLRDTPPPPDARGSVRMQWPGLFELELPRGWSCEEQGGVITLFRADGVGALQISIATHRTRRTTTMTELRASARASSEEHGAPPPRRSDIVDRAYEAEHVDDDEDYWRVWHLAGPGRIAFVTYVCEASDARRERRAVEAIVHSFRWLPRPSARKRKR